MAHLKYTPVPRMLAKGVTLLQQIDSQNTSLHYIELKVMKLSAESSYQESLGEKEVCVVALTGKITVTDGEKQFSDLGTRKSVFEKIPTDSVYISIKQTFKISAVTEAVVVLCYAPSDKKKTTTLIKASDNTIEHRGVQQNKRLVHNILPDTCSIADRLLVVEVFTDGGNWSSYPPHKHDQDDLPRESLLEETYYHEMNPRQGFVFQRVYTDDRLLDETMTVENGDVVVVPKGYHPVGVPDGYDSYYLNVMAGPLRKWQFHNDPAHEWLLDRK
ncbi:5-deoxy-glucuronate isomerase [Enterococcus termitis]|jgi:5-deoxy-glucuronate isomerase|uniref:5-deoxy-glucuronate isomerase n=1 Tax=Enterococcus termitis TaxID=332950 RepID=A0A1E5H248_9ENTE|nr:5-deoxy-glucuronate isomerase [Enterococcus termitis]OEG18942.1 5-deoxy-glucuronate isomerase [Enterococcus termitis]OJG97372.1 5-deoxy-glucuronate isomerase [Enterococcus termitis]